MKKYVNAKQILPQHLIEEIQKYVEGAHLYIPQKGRKSWGSANGSREQLEKRNMEIQFLFRQQGVSIIELAARFGLSEERIRSILYDK
ncbi:hypothetical protein D3H35_22325 [Cohnella faecalis]|uniref:Mor transcription activator domain-containing protein n=2 Tax=Cohnella faecalis TaxID=2315694 RepID=A0A398CQF9_9BACL|nr:hypothetical protein D3H35_22325 [Cohnella faecalis]